MKVTKNEIKEDEGHKVIASEKLVERILDMKRSDQP